MKNILRFPSRRQGHSDIQDQAAQWIVLFDKKKPSKEEFKHFLRWYRQDQQHRDAFQKLAETWNLAVKLPQIETTKRPKRIQKRWLPLAISAIIAAVVVSATLSINTDSLPSYNEQLATADQERMSYRLLDGSEILLDTNTLVNVSFDSDQRITKLKHGQAHFKVQEDQGRPFSVETPLGSIIAFNTAFTVDIEQEQLEVLVTEGDVEIHSMLQDQPVHLEAGYHYVLSSLGTQKTKLNHETIMNRSAWQQGMLIFTGETLAIVMQAMGRYHDIEFGFDAPEIAAMKIGGTFAADNLMGLLDSLKAGFNLSYRYEAQENRLVLFKHKSPAN